MSDSNFKWNLVEMKSWFCFCYICAYYRFIAVNLTIYISTYPSFSKENSEVDLTKRNMQYWKKLMQFKLSNSSFVQFNCTTSVVEEWTQETRKFYTLRSPLKLLWKGENTDPSKNALNTILLNAFGIRISDINYCSFSILWTITTMQVS